MVQVELTGICRTCWESLEPWRGPACARCGLPIPSGHVLESSDTLCGQCRRDEGAFDVAGSFGLYAGKLRAAILLLKFQRRERLGWKLGKYLAPVWETVRGAGEFEQPAFVPVPLHPRRERERGFNQAVLLAQGLSRQLGDTSGVPSPRLETRWLRRTRSTLPQAGLSLGERQENVRGVFEVVSPGRVRDRVLVLVDDVMTTGATLSACAGALKTAGARRVMALTLARATPRFPDDASTARGVPVDELHEERT